MDLTRIKPRDRQHIQKYGANGFTVSGLDYDGPVFAFATETIAWAVEHPDRLTAQAFAPLLERTASVDLCLLGSGRMTRRVPKEIRGFLKQGGINIEAMETGAACRTFNVLSGEGRALVAALFPTSV